MRVEDLWNAAVVRGHGDQKKTSGVWQREKLDFEKVVGKEKQVEFEGRRGIPVMSLGIKWYVSVSSKAGFLLRLF